MKSFSPFPLWGPYGKKYMGLSRIVEHGLCDGVRFDFCTVPAIFGGDIRVPNCTLPSGCHPWRCSPDYSLITYRHDLEWKDRVQVRACFKQATAPEMAGNHLCSAWQEATTPRRPLPLVLDMEALYAALLEPLAPWPRRSGEALPHWMQRLEAIADCERQIRRLEAQLRREKQFNRKIPLNRELREVCKKFEGLKEREEPPCKN